MSPAGSVIKGITPILAVMAGALANSLACMGNAAIGSPLFFDSIFTAVNGALFGPWAGCPCSLAAGLVSALLLGGRGKGYSILRGLLCWLAVALSNVVFGAVIAAFVYAGSPSSGHPFGRENP